MSKKQSVDNAKVQTKKTQSLMDAEAAFDFLKKGNARFVNAKQFKRDLGNQVKVTSKGQYPFAVVLSCIDSRVPVETIFDQGIGDIFSARVAGNFVNEDILGSIEYSCMVAGSKLVLVLGHTSCGAVKAACDHEQGYDGLPTNIVPMLEKIMPSVNAVRTDKKETRNSENKKFVNRVVYENVRLTINNIRIQSPGLRQFEDEGKIRIIGAVYNVSTGKVEFL